MKYKRVPFKELWKEYANTMLMCWTALWMDAAFVAGTIRTPNEPILYVLIAMAGFQTAAALHGYMCQKRHTKAQIDKWVTECLEEQLPKMALVAEAEKIADQGF